MRAPSRLLLFGLFVSFAAHAEEAADSIYNDAFPPNARMSYSDQFQQSTFGLAEAAGAPVLNSFYADARRIQADSERELIHLRRQISAQFTSRQPADTEFFKRVQLVHEFTHAKFRGGISPGEEELLQRSLRFLEAYPGGDELRAALRHAEEAELRAFASGERTVKQHYESRQSFARGLRHASLFLPLPLLFDGVTRLHALGSNRDPGFSPLLSLSFEALRRLARPARGDALPNSAP